MSKLYEKLLFKFFGVIGYGRLFKCSGEVFSPGPWIPRYDTKGRIYMVYSAKSDDFEGKP